MLKQKDSKKAALIEACIKGQCTIKYVAAALGLSKRRVEKYQRSKKSKIHFFIYNSQLLL